MTAATITLPPLKELLAEQLDRWAAGTAMSLPAFCADCLAAVEDRCDSCALIEADLAVLNDGIGKVRQSEDEALAAYMKTCMRLAGFPRTTERGTR